MNAGDLLEDLGSSERTVLRRACDQLAPRLASEPALRAALLEKLRGSDPLARFGAAYVLFHGERPGLRLLPALLGALELADGDLRWQATQMLAVLGGLHGEVLPVLVHEARNASSPLRRRMALYALRDLGPQREEVEAALLDAFADPDAEVRRAALACLAKLTLPSPTRLERVLEVARADPDPRMRRIAAVILPILLRASPERRAEVERAIEALARADDPSLARAARAARAQLDPGVRSRPLVLASASPRRRALLETRGFRFEVLESDVDERPLDGESPSEMVARLALAKARGAAARAEPGAVVLGFDTIVVLDAAILGKPPDPAGAVEMLLRIAGRTHTVFTGWAAIDGSGGEKVGVETSRVTLRPVSRSEAEAYAASGEPLDKAGAYAVQGEGGRFVTQVEGSFSNVIGLPLERIEPLLAALGVSPQ